MTQWSYRLYIIYNDSYYISAKSDWPGLIVGYGAFDSLPIIIHTSNELKKNKNKRLLNCIHGSNICLRFDVILNNVIINIGYL